MWVAYHLRMRISITDNITYSQVKSPPEQPRILLVHSSERLQGTLKLQFTIISHTKSRKNTAQTKARTDLPIEALKLPDAVSLIVNLIPPPQPNQNPAAHVLDHPKVERRKEHGDHKDDHKALHKEREQDVEG